MHSFFSLFKSRVASRRPDSGMTTAEYAVGTVAAVAFAAVLYRVVRSDTVATMLSDLITSALHSL